MLIISEQLKKLYPHAKFGVLVMKDVQNPSFHQEFNNAKLKIIHDIKESNKDYIRKNYIQTEPVKFYINYYKKFKKTYPVLLQLESIVLKDKSIPNIAALVEAMFTAEVKNMLLTAGHDYDKIKFPLNINIASGTESYVGISKKEQKLHENDMMLSDKDGVISSIINGPDFRTAINKDTKNALFFIYGTDGISEDIIYNHLNDIKNLVSIISPNSSIELMNVY